MHYHLSLSKKNTVLILFFLMFHWTTKSEIGINRKAPELPIVIITSSYNNASWVIKSLDSVFMQEYNNFRLVYIDDCSNDNTADIVQAYVNWYGLEEKVLLIKNDVKKLKMENIYKVIHNCNDTDIILILDGDDWFAHEKVLTNINKKYQEDNWFVYGQVKFFEDGEVGIGQAIPANILENRNFRKLSWIFRHPITFYAWLFKLIPLKDLLTNKVPGFQGKFYPYCNDRAMIYPMLEMAQYHIDYISEIAVIQNRFNPLSSQNVSNLEGGATPTQVMCYRENTSRPVQQAALEQPIINHLAQFTSATADCLIFSENNPIGLSTFLDTIHYQVKGVDQYCVIYKADNNELCQAYQELKGNYSHIRFSCMPMSKQQLVSIIEAFENEHILLLFDTEVLNQAIDCNYAIYKMESAFAYIFHTSLSTGLLDGLGIPYQHIEQGLFAWKFACDKKHLLNTYHLNGSLYKKRVIIETLSGASYSTVSQLQNAWESASIDTNNVGLFVDKK